MKQFSAARAITIGERIDTEPMRRLDQELLAGRSAAALDVESIRAELRTLRLLLDELDALDLVNGARLGCEPITELAVQRILTLLVELAFAVNGHGAVTVLGRAPRSHVESFDLAGRAGMISDRLAAELRPSAALRNLLMFTPFDVDREQVAQAVPSAITQYREYVRQVEAFVAEHAG